MQNIITMYCVPNCSELWTEEQARDVERGYASPCGDCQPAKKSTFERLRDRYVEAYQSSPLLTRSSYLNNFDL